jgi:hypothetical protein
VWALTPEGSRRKTLDKEEVKGVVTAMKSSQTGERESSEAEEPAPTWEDRLLEIVREDYFHTL